MSSRIDYRLYLVTDDPSRYGAADWLDNVIAAVEGGVTCVQYRDTESDARGRYCRLLRLRDALRPRRVPLVVNNDVELAAAVHAEGVHVGQSDLPPAAVREIVGPDCEIGLSITALSQLEAIKADSVVSCLGIGPVFDARKTKVDASAAMGIVGLSDILGALDSFSSAPSSRLRSTVAIGGITLDNASEVLATGVDGLAVVSAFSKSDNPHAVAKEFTLLSDHRRL